MEDCRLPAKQTLKTADVVVMHSSVGGNETRGQHVHCSAHAVEDFSLIAGNKLCSLTKQTREPQQRNTQPNDVEEVSYAERWERLLN